MTDSNNERPSDLLQTAIQKAVASAIEDVVDWDMTEKLIGPVLDYVRKCVGDPRDGFYIGTRESGVEIQFGIDDEGEEIYNTGGVSLFDICDDQWPDCDRSQADLIFALECDIARLKAAFQAHFGFPHDEAAIDANLKKRFPHLDYKKWQPPIPDDAPKSSE